jgi:hypothetical protein
MLDLNPSGGDRRPGICGDDQHASGVRGWSLGIGGGVALTRLATEVGLAVRRLHGLVAIGRPNYIDTA